MYRSKLESKSACHCKRNRAQHPSATVLSGLLLLLTTRANRPEASTEIPKGALNVANAPTPFADPAKVADPANVVTLPDETTSRRTRLFPVSAYFKGGDRWREQ